jgi:hypothetical protein
MASRWSLFATICGFSIVAGSVRGGPASDFKFDRDILAFKNSTVFEYHGGYAYIRRTTRQEEKTKRYVRRCFVMTRTVVLFHNFARFDPTAALLDDRSLAKQIRLLARRHPWDPPIPENERIVFPGYANLREMSEARGRVLQDNIGLGWPTYARIGNFRMFFLHSEKYQERTHANLNVAMDRGDFFIAYLSSYPHFTINHSVLVYARKPSRSNSEIEHYLVYDPNHPDAPRVLRWSPSMRVFNYQKDEEFVGGFTRAYQVYGKWLQ